MVGKRPRNTHYISGFGDGHVRDAALQMSDDLLYRKSRRYVRGSKQAVSLVDQKGEGEDRVYNLDAFQNSQSEDGRRDAMVQEPWLYSAMILLAVMGLLVALFLQLITDNSPENRKKRPSTLKKKKTDDWSDDCETDQYYSGDHEGTVSPSKRVPLFYHTQRQYPTSRNRKSGSSKNNLYFSSNEAALAGTYRSPTNSYSSKQQHTPQQHNLVATPHRGRFNARPLSPVSSFDNLPGTDEELPLPPGVTRGKQPSVVSNESRKTSRFSRRIPWTLYPNLKR